MARFQRYIGIDYSGAGTPDSPLPGLRVYQARGAQAPEEIRPDREARRHWSRRGLAQWLLQTLGDPLPTLLGIDHGFSFPLAYFRQHGLREDWPAFLDDFHQHWPSDGADVRIDAIRRGELGQGPARTGNSRWRRVCEQRSGSAKSVFHFDVPGSVAKSTHAGLPWLRLLRQQLGAQLHCWPYDGWPAPAQGSLIAEVYPSLLRAQFPMPQLSLDQQDAYAACCWLQQIDQHDQLAAQLHVRLSPEEQAAAHCEGWILGVPGAG